MRALARSSLLFAALPLFAQSSRPAVTVAGHGVVSVVMISGVVGGTATFQKLATRLADEGYRAIAIDPYQLSVDSADVTFDALARRVARELHGRGVERAIVVGHGHGAGVALRLAANDPALVSALHLLEGGPLGASSTPALAASLKLAAIIAKFPGGRGFVRGRFIAQLAENSANAAWIDDATVRAYVDPVLDHMSQAVATARRVSEAREPEPLAAVMARINVPIVAIYAAKAYPSSPDTADFAAIAQLGERAHTVHMGNAGYFLQEEAPAEIAHLISVTCVATVARAGRPR